MTRYLQLIFNTSRHQLEPVNKFPEILVYRKESKDNNQGMLKEKLYRSKTKIGLQPNHL